MKAFFALLLLAIFVTNTQAQLDMCFVCFEGVPKSWEAARGYLARGCGRLGEAKSSCVNLLLEADLTKSYDNMYPFIVQLKDIGCKYYCRVQY